MESLTAPAGERIRVSPKNRQDWQFTERAQAAKEAVSATEDRVAQTMSLISSSRAIQRRRWPE